MRKYSLQLFVLLLFLVLSGGILFCHTRSVFAGEGAVVRVGLFANKPMCYVDAAGKPAGIFVSVLEYVAAQEGWTLVYVEGSFSVLLTQLEKGEIDIIPSTAVSEERKKLYAYNAVDVFNNWAEVYIRPKTHINSLLELKNKRVSTLEKGIYSTGPEGIIRLDRKFHLNCSFLLVADYKAALEAVSSRQADAAVVNRLVGATYAQEFGLIKSGIVFAPVEIRFVFNKENPATPARIAAMDRHLNSLIADPDSIYHLAINEALGERPATREKIPQIVWFAILIGGVLLVGLTIVALLLRWQIKRKTVHLTEAYNFNKQIIESIQEGIAVYGIEGGYLSWNPFMEKISGKPASEVLGKQPLEVFPFFRKSKIFDYFEETLRGELRPPFNFPYDIPESGKRGWVSMLNSPLKDSRGKITGVITIVREISAEKLADDTIKNNERMLRNLLESTSIVPWELDLKSKKFTYMGKQIESILGYPADTWKDRKTWIERLSPQDREDAVRFSAIETKKGNDHDFVYRAIHQDGSYRWIRNIISVVKEEDKAVRLVGFMHDITEQKTMALQNQNLEVRLQQAQKMEAIGTLAGGIAHDFNNILGGVLGYAELAREESKDGSLVAQDLDRVLESGYRARDLVKQILAFSRQDAVERMPLQPEVMIKEAIKMLRPSLPTTIEIQEHIAPEIGWIYADPTQFNQIVMNLCTNAFHAMEETGGRLEISLQEVVLSGDDPILEQDVAPGPFVQLSVADSGPGIETRVKEKIFDPYFTTKEIGRGTGMGLSIVHGIVKSYGGFVSLDSEPGEGCVFHVFLPVVEGKKISENEVVGPIPFGHERILFVDDEVLLAEMGGVLLERLGYNVTKRTSSLEALEIFQNQPDQFDLVITDQTMPGITGVDLARKMMQIRPDIPIILCTGYSTIVSEKQAKAVGIKEFAFKPLAKRNLALLIRKVLDEAEREFVESHA